MSERKYTFSWDTIGENLKIARPALGDTVRVEMYRLLQYTLRDILEEKYDHKMADELFRLAGAMAGKEFYKKFCKNCTDIASLITALESNFKVMGIGLLRVEEVNLETMTLTLNLEEDLDCSGLPDTNGQICVYDEGFLQGILEAFTGKQFSVQEIDCWCTGARTCRFNAKALPA